MRKILICEISGKRPGGEDKRPTEKFATSYDKVIISNNSDGYKTNWEIVNVPENYAQWYRSNIKTSENAWYAPMNRSYAIEYARDHGYEYIVQLDDNIKRLEIAYLIKDGDVIKRYMETSGTLMLDEYVSMLACILDNTDAAMAGCGLAGSSRPDDRFLSECYCYSFFMLNLRTCPNIFHGDFEDDIEYRLKCREKRLPSVMCCPLRYSKTGQRSNKDETGNRAAYTAAGLKRGEHMRILHGDVYECGYSARTVSTASKNDGVYFKHKLAPFKVGVRVYDMDAMKKKMLEVLEACATPKADKCIIKVKKLNDAENI